MINFKVDKEKTAEALIYIASKAGKVGRFHAAKILYFADIDHLRKFGRPITGDTYIAMENGPVPSFAYDVLKGTVSPADKVLTAGALEPVPHTHYPEYRAAREPNLSFFSKSDVESLDQAIAYCMQRSFGQLSDETHEHKAWAESDLNTTMSFDLILEDADPDVIEEAKSFAAYGAL